MGKSQKKEKNGDKRNNIKKVDEESLLLFQRGGFKCEGKEGVNVRAKCFKSREGQRYL